MKIAILGGPGAGKTTTCIRLQEILSDKYDISFHEEYARSWIRSHGMPKTFEDCYIITEQQLAIDKLYNRPGKILLLDCNIFLNLTYLMKRIDWANKEHRKMFLDISRRIQNDYEHIFFLPNRFWWYVTDGQRNQRYWDACRIGQDIRKTLDTFNVKYHVVKSVSFDKRIKEILKVIGVKNER